MEAPTKFKRCQTAVFRKKTKTKTNIKTTRIERLYFGGLQCHTRELGITYGAIKNTESKKFETNVNKRKKDNTDS